MSRVSYDAHCWLLCGGGNKTKRWSLYGEANTWLITIADRKQKYDLKQHILARLAERSHKCMTSSGVNHLWLVVLFLQVSTFGFVLNEFLVNSVRCERPYGINCKPAGKNLYRAIWLSSVINQWLTWRQMQCNTRVDQYKDALFNVINV